MLFCSADKYPPFRVDVVVLFARELLKRGHSIDWVLQSDEDCKKAYRTKWEGCDVWVGVADNEPTLFKRLKKHFFSISHDLKIFRLSYKKKYDVIQVKDKFISALIGIVAARINNTKFTYWLSYPFPEASIYEARVGMARYPLLYVLRGYVFKFLLYRLIIPASDHVFVQSEQMKQDMIGVGMPADKLTAVPMGVSLEKFSTAISETEINSMFKGKTILYLGTMHRVRRIDFLIRVLEKVKKNIPDIKLFMVGGAENPEDEKFLKDEAVRLGVFDSVIFTGNLPQQDALQYVRKADLCISPFYPSPILNSTSPTKLIEYMALGKPVVANDHPEQSLLINESGAGLCVAYDEEKFSTAIVELLSNSLLLKEMGEKGRKYVEEYRSYSKLADFVESRYLEICTE